MGTKRNNTTANNNEINVNNNTLTITAKVAKVATFKDDEKRVVITLDGDKFTSLDANQNEIETNSFGISTRLVVEQTAQKIQELQLANTLAMGKTLNPQIVGLCLTGATLTIERTLKRKGEPTRASDMGARENEVYSNDTWVTEIKDVKPNIAELFKPYLMQLMQTALCVKESKKVLNPFEALLD